MEFALNFLRSNVGIESPALLSSPFIVVTLGYYGHKREYRVTPDEAKRIVSQRVVYEACFSDGWVVRCQAITADSLAG
jgi:hypothetical protein